MLVEYQCLKRKCVCVYSAEEGSMQLSIVKLWRKQIPKNL